MAQFKKNNIQWMLAANPGRPKKFETAEDLWNHFIQYVNTMHKNPWYKNDVKTEDKMLTNVSIPIERPISLSGFCCFLGVHEHYLMKSEANKKKEDTEFSDVIKSIRQVIETQQLEGATVGIYNSNIVARKLGLVDKQEQTQRTIVVEQPEIEDD